MSNSNTWEQYWNKTISQSLLRLFRGIFNLLYVRRIVRFTLHSTVLEVGCGTGACSSILRRRGYKNIGVDISRTACKLSKKKIDVILADGRFLPFRDKSFSLCFSQGLIEHFSTEDVRRLLREMSRTSCAVIFSVGKFRGLLHNLHRLFNLIHLKWIFPDEHYYSKEELERTLREFSAIYRVEDFLFMDLIGFILPETCEEYD